MDEDHRGRQLQDSSRRSGPSKADCSKDWRRDSTERIPPGHYRSASRGSSRSPVSTPTGRGRQGRFGNVRPGSQSSSRSPAGRGGHQGTSTGPPPESENIQPFDIAVALALTLTRVEARMRAAKQGTANEVSTAHRTRVSDTANCISEMKAQLVAGRKPK